MGQTINIEKIESGAIVNIYNSTETEEQSKKASITLSAIDKYSSPLRADIEISPWGKEMFRVSMLLSNTLIGQVLEQKYLTYKNKEKAEKIFHELCGDFQEFKKMAEEERQHSSILIPKIHYKISQYKEDIDKPESKDLLIRHDMTPFQKEFIGSIPPGLLLHPVEEHFPSHEGIIRQASKKITALRLEKKETLSFVENFDLIDNKWIEKKEFDALRFTKSMRNSIDDTPDIAHVKQAALKMISPIFYGKKAETKKINKAIDLMGRLAMIKAANHNRSLNVGDYDLFIFDADRTIWDGECAANMSPPFKLDKENRIIIDSKGKMVQLKDNVKETLLKLRSIGKDLGLISKSEKKGVDYQNQPVILLLKEFGLLNLFNEMIAIDREIPKSAFIPDNQRAVFIDDDIKNLMDVSSNKSGVDVFDIDDVEFNPESVDPWNILTFGDDFEPIEVGDVESIKMKNPREILITMKDEESLDNFVDDIMENGIEIDNNAENTQMLENSGDRVAIKILLTDSGFKKISKTSSEFNWYKQSKRDYIPKENKPEKPSGKGWELDHKRSKHNGGTDNKSNLQWLSKKDHRNKSQEDFEYVGTDRHKKLKEKGKKSYQKYQKDCGEKKQQKDREELGERLYSKQQSDIAKKRWHSN